MSFSAAATREVQPLRCCKTLASRGLRLRASTVMASLKFYPGKINRCFWENRRESASKTMQKTLSSLLAIASCVGFGRFVPGRGIVSHSPGKWIRQGLRAWKIFVRSDVSQPVCPVGCSTSIHQIMLRKFFRFAVYFILILSNIFDFLLDSTLIYLMICCF